MAKKRGGMVQKHDGFREELILLLDKYITESSCGNASDFTMSDYILDCVEAFRVVRGRREGLCGRIEDGSMEVNGD